MVTLENIDEVKKFMRIAGDWLEEAEAQIEDGGVPLDALLEARESLKNSVSYLELYLEKELE